MSNGESGVHRLTVEDVKKYAEDLQRVPKWSEEAQEVYDTLFNYFSQMILNSDFVKVVRCKDCKYADVGKADVWCDYYESYKDKDGYCDCGERKKQNEMD